MNLLDDMMAVEEYRRCGVSDGSREDELVSGVFAEAHPSQRRSDHGLETHRIH
jgi:hypothetical protein